MTNLIRELAGTELLCDLPLAILEQVAQHSQPLRVEVGEILLAPEHDNAYIFLLLSGALNVHFASIDSPVVREISPGGSVGEISVIDGSPASAYVVAKVTSRVFAIHRDVIQTLVTQTPSVAGNLLKLLTRWMRDNTHRIVNDRAHMEELTEHVHVDALTGLYNRRWLDNALDRLLAQSLKSQQGLGVLLIDVDYFKQYNDRHGHPAGDQALVALSHVLKTTLRPYDFATRYGGEEFLVLLPHTTTDEAITTAHRLWDAASSAAVYSTAGAVLPGITVSIGVAVSHAHSTVQSLVVEADEKLYEAKSAGRNCVRH